MKHFKMRFSYFLIMGLVGMILQSVSFFMWKKIDVTYSNLASASNAKYFSQYIVPQILFAVSAVFIIVMMVGFIVCAKKEQKFVKTSASILGVSQGLLLVITCVYLIFTSIVRKKMYSDVKNRNAIDVMIAIRNVIMVINLIAYSIFGSSLLKVNKKRDISKIGTWICIVTNGFAAIMLLVVLVTAFSKISSYYLISRLLTTSGGLPDPYYTKYGNINGFTFGELKLLFQLIDMIESYKGIKDNVLLNVSAYISMFSVLGYGLSIAGNFLFVSAEIVDSFDVSRDDDRMAI